MGKKREVNYINGRFSGKYLTEDICDKLEKLKRLDDNKKAVLDLKDIIYDLEPSQVAEIKDIFPLEYVGEKPIGRLENLQTIGVAYMFFARRIILGDSVGIGKTVEVCGLFNLLKKSFEDREEPFRFLFLTEKTAVPQVRDEVIRFTGDYAEIVYGTKKEVQDFVSENSDELHYSVVAPHSLVKSKDFQEYMRFYDKEVGYNPFDIIVIDESGDILCNPSTQYYKDAKYIADMFDRVVCLNATVFEKELLNFYSQLNFVDDTLLPTKTDFTKDYVIMSYSGPYPMPSGKYRNADKFRHLVGYRYFARTRKGTGAEMKDCTADVIVTGLSKEQRYLMDRVSMPRMVYECPSYFRMGIETNLDTTPKLRELLRIITDTWKDARSILVYCYYKESQVAIQRVLDENGIDSEIMNGSFSAEEREDVVNRFKLGDTRILITNVQKALNFGNCNHCVFYSYDSNPNKMVQFEGRMTRTYNIVDKHVILLISKGQELSNFKNMIADRAQASDVFAGSDFSCVLSILLNDNKLSKL